jgi:hypothetical protein
MEAVVEVLLDVVAQMWAVPILLLLLLLDIIMDAIHWAVIITTTSHNPVSNRSNNRPTPTTFNNNAISSPASPIGPRRWVSPSIHFGIVVPMERI